MSYTSRDLALDLHDHGFQVVITPRGGKRPNIAWKGFQETRVPRAQVEEWFRLGEHNIAIITGPISNLVVVDGDSLEACACIESICAPTPMQVVTSKGRHYYYRHPGGRVPNSVRVMDDPPVDLRGDGGLVIGPGSRHPGGHIYHIAPECDLCNPGDLPVFDRAWLPLPAEAQETKFVRPILRFATPASKDAFSAAQQYINKTPGAGAGERNHRAYVQACRLVRGFNLPDDQALDLLLAWNSKCTPPLGESEVQPLIHHARAYGTGEFGALLADRRREGLLCFGWP